jgi:hypothetical protein
VEKVLDFFAPLFLKVDKVDKVDKFIFKDYSLLNINENFG